MENVGLDESLELTANQGTSILHNIGGSDCMNGEAIDIGCLEANHIFLFLLWGPGSVRDMPDIFDDPEKNCVQNFDRGIFRRIKAYVEFLTRVLIDIVSYSPFIVRNGL